LGGGQGDLSLAEPFEGWGFRIKGWSEKSKKGNGGVGGLRGGGGKGFQTGRSRGLGGGGQGEYEL